MSRYTLLTGATGSLSQYLLRDLLVQNERVAVLARPTQSQSVRERIESIVQVWERQLKQYLPRPQYFVGDLCQPNCGLTDSDCVWIRRHCRRAVHCIAQATIQESSQHRALPQANVDSVELLLELCRRCGIGDLHYVSSALVSGQRQGTISEDELDEGQTFDNAYDESRFQAELIVQDSAVPRRTIYRPCVMAGDSATGASCLRDPMTASVQEVVHQAEAGAPFNHNSETGSRNAHAQYVAPVDWVARTIGQILKTPEAWGQTFHICPSQTLTRHDVAKAVHGYRQTNTRANLSAPVAAPRPIPFRANVPHYERSNLVKFAGEIPCPRLDRMVIERYCDFLSNASSRQGDEHGIQVEHWSDAVVSFARPDVIGALMDGLASSTSETIGLDVVGSGGGQWSLQRGPIDLLTVTPGLPAVKVPVIRVTTVELSQLLEAPCDRWSA